MKINQLFFRIGSFLRHRLTARHTMGYSIHSPYLFYIAREILPETKPYYCFDAIETLRRRMLTDKHAVEVVDYGTGKGGRQVVRDVARASLKPAQEAQLLMRLGVMLGARRVVELGTSLGLTTAYLASIGKAVKVTTFEGSSELLKLAQDNWRKLGLKNISAEQGNIDDRLPAWVEKHQGEVVDLAFIDANHCRNATLRYFDQLLPLMGDRSICVVDDIHGSAEMQAAWNALRQHPRVTGTFDLYSMGMLFFDPHLEHRTYRIRL